MPGGAEIGVLIPLMESVKDIKGDYIELGAYKGETFVRMSEFAFAQQRYCYAVDSFVGCGEPTAKDGDQYAKGCCNAGGTGPLRKRLGYRWGSEWDIFVDIFVGWIPEVFQQITNKTFAFVHVDLDQYKPTLETLNWVWPKIAPGGIVACHDYTVGRKILATPAIDQFMADHELKPEGIEQTTIWFRKSKGSQSVSQ